MTAKKFRMWDIVKRAGVPDRNGNVYTRPVLENALKRWAEGGFKYGVIFDKSEDGSPEKFASVSSDDAAFEVKLEMVDEGLKATIETVVTDEGVRLSKMMDAGMKFSIGMCCTGTVKKKKNGVQEVDDVEIKRISVLPPEDKV
jgi:hypothetical protein